MLKEYVFYHSLVCMWGIRLLIVMISDRRNVLLASIVLIGMEGEYGTKTHLYLTSILGIEFLELLELGIMYFNYMKVIHYRLYNCIFIYHVHS